MGFYLGRVGAFGIGIFEGDDLEEHHPERIDVDLLRVGALLVHLGRHELGGADQRGRQLVLDGRQAEIPQLDVALIAVDAIKFKLD
eukprot:SAG31_NODE_1864_length_7036_cov_3.477584_8_plen_86_part_00